MTASARISQCGAFVHLSDGAWSEVFGVEKLEGRIAFYRRLADRRSERMGQSYRKVYQPMIDALERCQRELQQRSAV